MRDGVNPAHSPDFRECKVAIVVSSEVHVSDERPAPAGARYHLLVWLFAGCFFFSGSTGLIYQNVWVRILGLYFGNTATAISAVLTAFMSGLALGSWLVSGRSDRVRNPLLTYAVIEFIIGCYCLLTPRLLSVAHDAYSAQVVANGLGLWPRTLLQFALCLVVLILPTALMGATLPILSAGLQRIMGTVSRTVGNLYAINTFGAVAGTVITAFVLLQYVGAHEAILLAAAINIAIGTVLAVFSVASRTGRMAVRERQAEQRSRAQEAAAEDPSERALRRYILTAFFVAGFCALTCEVIWTRVLCMMIGSSVYSFAVILTAFLLGIALGSYLFALFWGDRKVGIGSFGIVEAAIGLFCIALTVVFSWMPEVFLGLFLGYNKIALPEGLLAAELLIAFAIVAPPTVLMGLAFPLVTKVLTDAGGGLGSSVGRAYASNTAGAILGSCLSTLVLVPLIGMRAVILIAGLLYVATGVAAMLIAAARARSVGWSAVATTVGALAVILAIVLPPWSTSALSFGVFQSNQVGNADVTDLLGDARQNPERLVFYREGPSAVVSVSKWERGGGKKAYAIAVNGKVDASTSPGDMPTQVMTGHLPCLLMDDPKRVVLIGLGSGISAACIARHSSVEDVTCVEIEPNVAVGARGFFGDLNDEILVPGKDPRFHLAVDDGRSFVQRSAEPFDIIISEPSNPWIAGVGNLYTREFYETCRDKLTPEGIMVQWTQLYSLSPTTLRMILNTFSSVFENVSVFHPTTGDVLLVASRSPIILDRDKLQARIDAITNLSHLTTTGGSTPEELTAYFLLSDADLRKLARGAEMNTDNLPLLEFWAPRALYADFGSDNFQSLLAARSDSLPPEEQMVGFALTGTRGAQFHLARGRSYKKHGCGDLALAEFRRSVELDDTSAEAQAALSVALTGDRKPYLGLGHARLAADLDPESAEAFDAYGYAQWQLYDFANAIRNFETALELDPGNEEYQTDLEQCRKAAEEEKDE